jgi:DNA-binding transcriptional regulator YdaS (Cro superfamily)
MDDVIIRPSGFDRQAVSESLPGLIDTSMKSFGQWLDHRLQEVPDSTTLALAIARAGSAGISPSDLRRQSRLLPDVLQSLLAALTAAGQVTVVSVGGELRYRAVG